MGVLQPTAKNPKWHAGRIICACAGYFDWLENRMLTEEYVDGGLCDLFFVSKSGYGTEIEVKVSLADWNADRDKAKWGKPRPHVSRFFYAIPETLESKIPDWLPAEAGIAVVRDIGGHDRVHLLRPAKRIKATKIPQAWIEDMFRRCYYRFWRAELRRRRALVHPEVAA